MKSERFVWALAFLMITGITCDENRISESQKEDRQVKAKGSGIFMRHRGEDHIPNEFLDVCGIPPVTIDTRTYKCENYIIVSISTPSTPSTYSTTKSTMAINNHCSDRDVFTCNNVLRSGCQAGYQCCGFDRFHPAHQTCCQKSSAKYKIHDGMPEKNHICCGVSIYNRGSNDVPCEHPSLNDNFFRKLTKPKSLNDNNSLCNEDRQYLYRIDVKVQNTSGDKRYVEATISMWPWELSKSYSKKYFKGKHSEQGYMRIPLDKYSPWKKNLIGKSFFTITNTNYLEKAVFFLSRQDKLYRWPKSPKRRRRIVKLLRKFKRKCRKQRAKYDT